MASGVESSSWGVSKLNDGRVVVWVSSLLVDGVVTRGWSEAIDDTVW